jgi:glycerate-2-kinase
MGIIRNFSTCATTPLRERTLRLIEAGIERVLPENLIRESIRYDPGSRELWINGSSFRVKGRIFVVGGGKASGAMASSLEKVIGPENIKAGVVAVKDAGGNSPEAGQGIQGPHPIEIVPAGHPYPDERGVQAARRIFGLKEGYSIGADDTVICLISGGGSSLMVLPESWITLEDKHRITRLLLACGADIHEINTVRKHLSCIKGGKLKRHFEPARVISLVISDVIGDDLGIIASGPTVPDSTSAGDAVRVLEKYDLERKIPPAVMNRLRTAGSTISENAAIDRRESFENNFIIGSNSRALEAVGRRAMDMGLKPVVVTSEQAGETGSAARSRARQVAGGLYGDSDTIILGGETTPVLPADRGKGGRNQHYAAVTMAALRGFEAEWAAASVGTDGSDYVPNVAGAVVDNSSLDKLLGMGLDLPRYLEKYDSGTVLEKLGDALIETGPTGTNVCDIMVYSLRG